MGRATEPGAVPGAAIDAGAAIIPRCSRGRNPAMRVYAEKPARLALQLLADLAVVAWVAGWCAFAAQVQEFVLRWKSSGQDVVHAGNELRSTFAGAARTAGAIPFAGDDLSGVLGRGTAAGEVLTRVGDIEMQAVGHISTAVGVLIVVLALIPVLVWWLPRRVRYARAASTAVAMRTDAGDLLALRALATQPYRRLKRISPDAAAAWRQGDAEIIDRLADAQLDGLGLRPLRRSAGGTADQPGPDALARSADE